MAVADWIGDGVTADQAEAEDREAAFLDRVHKAVWWQVRLDVSKNYGPTLRWLSGPGFLRSGIVQALVSDYGLDPDVLRDQVLRESQCRPVERASLGRKHRVVADDAAAD